MQQEIAVTGNHPGLAHQRPFGGGGSKGLQIGFGLVLEADHAERDEIEPEPRAVQHRVIAFDDARFFEFTHPTQAGRR